MTKHFNCVLVCYWKPCQNIQQIFKNSEKNFIPCLSVLNCSTFTAILVKTGADFAEKQSKV